MTIDRLEGRLPPGSAEGVSAVAEILPTTPTCRWWPTAQPVLAGGGRAAGLTADAFRELVLPQTEVLVGNHQTLMDFLLPDWDSERPARRASWPWPPPSMARATCS